MKQEKKTVTRLQSGKITLIKDYGAVVATDGFHHLIMETIPSGFGDKEIIEMMKATAKNRHSNNS